VLIREVSEFEKTFESTVNRIFVYRSSCINYRQRMWVQELYSPITSRKMT